MNERRSHSVATAHPRRWAPLCGPALVTLLVLGSACQGTIGDSSDPGAGATTPKTAGPGGGQAGNGPGVGTGMGTGGSTPQGPGGPTVIGPITSSPTDTVRLSRLSHKQWENTVRDLFRVSVSPVLASSFVTEPVRGTFDNNGGLMEVSPTLWTDYQRAAETVADTVVKDPKKLAAIMPANLPADPAGQARGFIVGFGLRAYRRPLTTAEVDQYVALFNQGPKLVGSGNAFNDGVQLMLMAFLQSPHFLFRTELSGGTAVNGKIPLSDYEVAAKLSYALASSMPDDMLFAAAAAKQLGSRDVVLEHARRLLMTPAGTKTVEDFHAQLLNMGRYDQITKDVARFPLFPAAMGGFAKTETLAFARDVLLTRDKGLSELFLAPYTFVNSKLGAVYGLTMPAPPAMGMPDPFVRVDLDPTQRAGILTQLGFLAAYADGSQPQTILRGAFINREILCQPLPPPPDAFTLPPAMGRTNRQRVESATNATACTGCHTRLINPPGFALEGYDAIGHVRTMDGTQMVDTTGVYTFDGVERSFNGGVELSKWIAGSHQAHDCYAHHWMEYLYGRLVDGDSDKSLSGQLGARSVRGDSLRSLILEMVATDTFLTRAPARSNP